MGQRQGVDPFVQRLWERRHGMGTGHHGLDVAITVTGGEQWVRHIPVFVEPVGLVPLETVRVVVTGIILDEPGIGRCRQVGLAVFLQRVVQVTEGRQHQVDAPAVLDNVVQVDDEVERSVVELDQVEAEQRPLLELECHFQPLLHPGLGRGLRFGAIGEIDQRDPHLQRLDQGLHGHAVATDVAMQDRAQGIVLADQQFDCLLHTIRVDGTLDMKVATHGVQGRIALGHLVQPDIPLGRRQRIGCGKLQGLVHTRPPVTCTSAGAGFRLVKRPMATTSPTAKKNVIRSFSDICQCCPGHTQQGTPGVDDADPHRQPAPPGRVPLLSGAGWCQASFTGWQGCCRYNIASRTVQSEQPFRRACREWRS
ncbi:hypothetical protein SRABI112_01672 [Pseudomonas mediterranea]|nr:hypothetical protein SRABI112_01672 [Pseudomonas mediterranea]